MDTDGGAEGTTGTRRHLSPAPEPRWFWPVFALIVVVTTLLQFRYWALPRITASTPEDSPEWVPIAVSIGLWVFMAWGWWSRRARPDDELGGNE